MSAMTLFDPGAAVQISSDDSPVSGGVRAVLERGYGGRVNTGRLDTELLAATPEDLKALSAAQGLPLSILQRRSEMLEAALARQISG